jgi:hypothetical protein
MSCALMISVGGESGEHYRWESGGCMPRLMLPVACGLPVLCVRRVSPENQPRAEQSCMQNRNGRQKGAQRHAEGQHGSKAHSHFIESLHEGGEPAPNELGVALPDGGHRLHEDREQHDEAEKNSEKNRLEREAKRHRIDRASPQVPEALKGSPPEAK